MAARAAPPARQRVAAQRGALRNPGTRGLCESLAVMGRNSQVNFTPVVVTWVSTEIDTSRPISRLDGIYDRYFPCTSSQLSVLRQGQ